ncbi:MAG: hypothetical protein DMG07_11675 [Acidobacteria bacterium]|nr:MAG: hypothetical protein DMG07_11675 [Acidobacteriota bacterium]
MGTFYIRCKIENPFHRTRSVVIPRLVVDTGSEYTRVRRTLMRHSILSVSSAKARLLELTRKVNEEGKAYLLTKDGEPVSALVPVEDYEALLETHDILVDHKTMKDLAAALDDEKRSRLWKRDQSGKWTRLKKTKGVTNP